MSTEIIDGKLLAKNIRKSLKDRVDSLSPKLGRAPGLATVLVGDDPASHVYVASKSKSAKKCGLHTVDVKFPASVSQDELCAKLRELSSDEAIDGILLQLPLPDGLDEFAALSSIAPEKDADGLHPLNQGLLVRGANAPRPCTPRGCIELVKQARRQLGASEDLSGLHACVLGRSILVGKPAALLLLEENCTVAMCHSRTKNLTEEISRADILIAAVGRPKLVSGEQIKEGAIVIDVGINRLETGELVGDVDYDAASKVAGAITPVPGGCGPMTIAMLLVNTVDAAEATLVSKQ